MNYDGLEKVYSSVHVLDCLLILLIIVIHLVTINWTGMHVNPKASLYYEMCIHVCSYCTCICYTCTCMVNLLFDAMNVKGW